MKKVFIASSTEAILYAEALKTLLEEDKSITAVVWKDAEFRLGISILKSLENLKRNYDSAIFIFHPDDELNFKGETMKSVRDNVIFEFGLFGGAIGFDNCFALVPNNISIRKPSDLMGILYATYKYIKNDPNIASSLRTSIEIIRKGIRDAVMQQNEHLVRGDYRKSIVDATIHTDVVDFKLYSSWIDSIRLGSRVKEDLLYWDRGTAEKWIKYESHKNQRLNHIHDISKQLKDMLESSVDVISLGPGSGEKDKILLQTLSKKGNSNWYYPIDISSHILNNALHKITGSFDDRELKVKGIRANFDSLQSLRFVYQYTNSTNLFLLMGNTLGNYNEKSLLLNIYESMFDNDLLVIEVNRDRGQEINSKNLSNAQLKEFIIQPLISLGIEAEIDNLKFEESNGIYSDVSNAIRFAANYHLSDAEKDIIVATNNVISITYSTLYNKKELGQFFIDVGFEIEYSLETDNQLSFILRKVSK